MTRHWTADRADSHPGADPDACELCGPFRCVWGEPFPEWADFATRAEATRFALRTSREQECEVAVIPLEGVKNGPESRSDGLGGPGAGADTSETTNKGEK